MKSHRRDDSSKLTYGLSSKLLVNKPLPDNALLPGKPYYETKQSVESIPLGVAEQGTALNS
jgi:hypothetical protein